MVIHLTSIVLNVYLFTWPLGLSLCSLYKIITCKMAHGLNGRATIWSTLAMAQLAHEYYGRIRLLVLGVDNKTTKTKFNSNILNCLLEAETFQRELMF